MAFRPSETADERTLGEIDYSRKWFVLTAIAMAILLGTIDGSIVNVALPTLTEEFGTSFGVVQWVSLGYLLTQATLTLGFGRLGDMVGKKPIFTAGFAVFTAFSVAAGLAPTVELLILARVFQAVGAAMIFALGFAITTEAFPPTERGKALGINGAMVSIGIIAGPVLGGLLIDLASWRLIFLVNLPIGIIGTITAIRFVPNTRPRASQRFDWAGAVAFFIAFLSLLAGLTHSQEAGLGDPVVIGAIVVSILSFVVFVGIERTTTQPMVDLSLFSNRDLSAGLLVGFLQFVAISGLFLILPFYLDSVLGFSTRQIGLLLASIPISLGILAPISGSLSDRLGTRKVTTAGLVVTATGFTLAAILFDTDTTALQFVATGLVIGAGFGLFQSPNNSAILGAVPSGRLGITSGMLTINRITGQIVGIAVLGTLWAARTTAYAGGGTAESAGPSAQAAGLRDTLIVSVILTTIAVGIAVTGWRRQRRGGIEAALEPSVPL
ncbi:MAG TPA: DHA2 family efflux MFS transporter permease subunit [Acidimicrobiia bacterium]|nr:DHA2 family efflux MFS transporter permease subunit [Acidimicrobiia bacterium]